MMRTFPRLSKKPNAFGSYEILWTEVHGDSHRTKRKSTKTGDRLKAEEELARFLTVRGEGSRQKAMTVSEAFDAYLRLHSIPQGNERTDRFVMTSPLAAFGDWPADGIRDIDIENYSRRRAKGQYSSKGVNAAPSTIRREIVALQAVLNFVSRKELIPGKPVFRFTKPSDGESRVVWLTEEQQTEVMQKAAELAPLTVRLFLRMALTYGVRRGAMLDLRFGDQVNFLTNTIDFNVPGRRITRKRRPSVPMTKSIRADLEEMLKLKKRGDRVLDATTPYQYDRFMKSIGYGWVHAHALKHAAITLMLRAGVKEMDVARITSTDMRTIARVYRHHGHDELLDIMEARGI
jgi:integrase